MRLVSKNLSVLAVIAGLSFWGTACNNNKVSGNGAVGDAGVEAPVEDEDVVGQEEEEVVDELVSSYGLLNFRQLAATFESVTGVQLNNADVLAEYEKQLASLPKSFDPASISAAKVSAVTKLAASYCDVMAADANLMTTRVGMDAAGLAALTDGEYAATVLDAFFGAETALQGDRGIDTQSVTELLVMLRTVTPTDGGNLQQAMFMGTCAAVLSSAEFFMY